MDELARKQAKARLASLYRPVMSGGKRTRVINTGSWWQHGDVLQFLGELLAHPFLVSKPTIVIGPQSSGHLLGALVAAHLGIGLAAARSNPSSSIDADPWVTATTPPDYQDRHQVFGLRKNVIRPSDVVLGVDDVIDTGSQMTAMRNIAVAAGATWAGASVLVDLLERNSVRPELGLATVFHSRELPEAD